MVFSRRNCIVRVLQVNACVCTKATHTEQDNNYSVEPFYLICHLFFRRRRRRGRPIQKLHFQIEFLWLIYLFSSVCWKSSRWSPKANNRHLFVLIFFIFAVAFEWEAKRNKTPGPVGDAQASDLMNMVRRTLRCFISRWHACCLRADSVHQFETSSLTVLCRYLNMNVRNPHVCTTVHFNYYYYLVYSFRSHSRSLVHTHTRRDQNVISWFPTSFWIFNNPNPHVYLRILIHYYQQWALGSKTVWLATRLNSFRVLNHTKALGAHCARHVNDWANIAVADLFFINRYILGLKCAWDVSAYRDCQHWTHTKWYSANAINAKDSCDRNGNTAKNI